MSKPYITSEEILEKGKNLNDIHKRYKDSGFNKRIKNEFYEACENYRKDVYTLIQSNPYDIIKTL